MTMHSIDVLLFAPNLVGHLRLLLIMIAAIVVTNPALCLFLFVLNFLLDGIDGWLARLFNQTTQFGAFYDVVIDIIARAVLWMVGPMPPHIAILPVLLECFTFACTHADASSVESADWKAVTSAPKFARVVLLNGLRNPLGAWAVWGLHGCPLWLFARGMISKGQPWATAIAVSVVSGRLIAAVVEVTLVCAHMRRLLDADVARLNRTNVAKQRTRTSKVA